MKYHKIQTIFKRDTEGTKKLIPGDFVDPIVEYLKDNEWIFTEKIDGTNIRVIWDGHNVSFKGRNENSSIPIPLMDKLQSLFGTPEDEQLFEQIFGDSSVIFYGEGYGSGIQTGGSYRKDVSFILFDIMINNVFLLRKDCEDIAKTFNIDIVPIILNGTIDQAIEFIKEKPNSTIGTAKMEGIVGRPSVELQSRFSKRVIVKIKVCDFL